MHAAREVVVRFAYNTVLHVALALSYSVHLSVLRSDARCVCCIRLNLSCSFLAVSFTLRRRHRARRSFCRCSLFRLPSCPPHPPPPSRPGRCTALRVRVSMRGVHAVCVRDQCCRRQRHCDRQRLGRRLPLGSLVPPPPLCSLSLVCSRCASVCVCVCLWCRHRHGLLELDRGGSAAECTQRQSDGQRFVRTEAAAAQSERARTLRLRRTETERTRPSVHTRGIVRALRCAALCRIRVLVV